MRSKATSEFSLGPLVENLEIRMAKEAGWKGNTAVHPVTSAFGRELASHRSLASCGEISQKEDV